MPNPTTTTLPEFESHQDNNGGPIDGKVDKPTDQARALVERIGRDPGFYSQMCSLPVEVGERMFSPYVFARFEQRVSVENFETLRASRAASLAALGESLDAAINKMRTTSAPSKAPRDFGSSELAMIIDLNGVELLGRLCDLAEIAYQSEATRTVSRTIISDVGTRERVFSLGNFDSGASKLLSTITAILRQERYPPMLNSEFEREYRAAVRKNADVRRSAGPPTLSNDTPNSWSYFDPLCEEFISFEPYCWMDLTPERFKKIIAWAREYLRTTPPEKRRAAEGMSPWPIVR